ncbi:hypothetical protein AAMO2058_000572200 [Amorphochlora amoebiformis]
MSSHDIPTLSPPKDISQPLPASTEVSESKEASEEINRKASKKDLGLEEKGPKFSPDRGSEEANSEDEKAVELPVDGKEVGEMPVVVVTAPEEEKPKQVIYSGASGSEQKDTNVPSPSPQSPLGPTKDCFWLPPDSSTSSANVSISDRKTGSNHNIPKALRDIRMEELNKLRKENLELKERLGRYEGMQEDDEELTELNLALSRLSKLEDEQLKQKNEDKARKAALDAAAVTSGANSLGDAPTDIQLCEDPATELKTKPDKKEAEEIAGEMEGLKYQEDSPFFKKQMNLHKERIYDIVNELKALAKVSGIFCSSCELMAEEALKFSTGISRLGEIEGLPTCVRETVLPVSDGLESMSRLLTHLSLEVKEIFNKDIDVLCAAADTTFMSARELSNIEYHYHNVLAAYCGDPEKSTRTYTAGSRSRSRTRARSVKVDRTPSPSKSNRSSASIISLWKAATGSIGSVSRIGRRSSQVSHAKLPQAHSVDAALAKAEAAEGRSMVDIVGSARERFEMARFEQVEALNGFLKGKMVDLAENCAAVFQFIHSFFKLGYYEANTVDAKILRIREGISVSRKYLKNRTEKISKWRSELSERLNSLSFDNSTMRDVTQPITGLDFKPVPPGRARNQPSEVKLHAEEWEKAGYLFKKGGGIRKAWSRRFFLIKDGNLYYVRSARDLELNFVANLVISSVKEAKNASASSSENRPFTFSLSNPQNSREYLLQATSERDMVSWISALRGVAERKLYALTPERNDVKGRKSVGAQQEASLFAEIKELNPMCADCGDVSPDWAVINKGFLICIACSGVHRSLGVQLSKVRSIGLDKWELATLDMMRRLGLERFNGIYEAEPVAGGPQKPQKGSSNRTRASYIRAKHVGKMFVRSLEEGEQKLLFPIGVKAACDNDVSKLLEVGALGVDINDKDDEGWTFLHHAAAHNALLAAEFCMLNGADLDMANHAGKTPIQIAKDTGSKKVLQRLEEYRSRAN